MEHWSFFDSSFSSSSSSSSSSSRPPDPSPSHVFLSFRGDDIGNTFASHLQAALTRQRIKTCVGYNLQKGHEVSASLVKAIEEAKLSVVIFSENYASSRECLDQLGKMIECKLKHGQITVPVFYHVDPSHVQNQTGCFADAFVRHERELKDSLSKVQRWRVALASAAKTSGWECSPNRFEAELVEKIAEDVSQKLEGMRIGGLEEKIAILKQTAQAKLERTLKTGTPNDMQDLTKTLQELGDLKLEKALRTDEENDWEELNTTNQRILQLKQQMFIRQCHPKAMEDYMATQHRVSQILKEQQNRRRGLYRGL
ncbi:disease resistance protein RPV1-like [Prosopis cineraria]|uniref:disease resistance protein RPV1-like n=1 Tax=Prosopis cineraria TaxID=364024 RepID=UPI002410A453|nr:disease resistance protein RPV1-like [Prosopis cineraria]